MSPTPNGYHFEVGHREGLWYTAIVIPLPGFRSIERPEGRWVFATSYSGLCTTTATGSRRSDVCPEPQMRRGRSRCYPESESKQSC